MRWFDMREAFVQQQRSGIVATDNADDDDPSPS